MRWPFRICYERQIEVHLHVELGFKSGRLADLVQLLARSKVTITDLEPDRSLYHVGMPERSTEVTFLVKTTGHKAEVLGELSAKGFTIRELSVPFR
jgi:(p)ppGpp synthase/HD superfamily hydrolase